MKRLHAVGLTVVAVLLCLSMAPLQAEYVEAVLAVVGEKVITSSEVRRLAEAATRNIPADISPEERTKMVNEHYTRLLNHLIDTELIYLDFKALKGKIPQKYVQERLDKMVVQQTNGDEEAFRDLLHEQQMTWKEFQEEVYKQIAVEMLTYDRTRRNLKISDFAVEEYYQQHMKENVSEKECNLQTILLRKNGKNGEDIAAISAEIRKKLSNGESFEKLVLHYSDSPTAQIDKGETGWQPESSLAPVIEKAVRGVKDGGVCQEDVAIGSGVYIIRVIGRRGGLKPLDKKLQQEIRTKLADKEAEKRYAEYIRTLYIKFPVKRFDR